MTLGQIAAAVGGWVVDGGADLQVTGDAFIDSRQAVTGGLFVAVAGERADGHDFADAAVSGGGVGALVSRPVGVPAVVVGDPVQALGVLAQHVLASVPALIVIGITGSQGKTSTKDMLAQLLERSGETVAPVGSFNTEIGVPLTALRVRRSTRYLVTEMGARGPDDIRYLAAMVHPSVGVVLNVGVAHLGEFGSRADIAAAKGQLVEALPADGLAILNADDRLVANMRDRTSAGVVTFGEAAGADIRLDNVHVDDEGRACFSIRTGAEAADIVLPLVGAHQARNAAAAAAAALGLGIRLADVAEALRSVTARSPWRMEVATTRGGVTVINDAYNANPDSMRAALHVLAGFRDRREPDTRTFAVLGEMMELGPSSDEEHGEVGRLAVRLGVSQLVVVGEPARPVHLAAVLQGSRPDESVCVADGEAALDFLRGALRPGDIVLVKASRAAGLEEVALALLEDAGTVDETGQGQSGSGS